MNILETSKKTRLSTYAQSFGTLGFNAAPMAPSGTKVVAHEKPNQRATWIKYAVAG